MPAVCPFTSPQHTPWDRDFPILLHFQRNLSALCRYSVHIRLQRFVMLEQCLTAIRALPFVGTNNGTRLYQLHIQPLLHASYPNFRYQSGIMVAGYAILCTFPRETVLMNRIVKQSIFIYLIRKWNNCHGI